jgi:hypothetical protein
MDVTGNFCREQAKISQNLIAYPLSYARVFPNVNIMCKSWIKFPTSYEQAMFK